MRVTLVAVSRVSPCCHCIRSPGHRTCCCSGTLECFSSQSLVQSPGTMISWSVSSLKLFLLYLDLNFSLKRHFGLYPLQCCFLLNSLSLSWLHLLHHVLQTVVGRVECVRRLFGLVCPVLALPVSRPLHCSALHLGAAPHHTHHQLSGVVWSQDGGGGAVLGHSTTTTIILYSNINISLSSYSLTSSINV